jgi:hypothetical protein
MYIFKTNLGVNLALMVQIIAATTTNVVRSSIKLSITFASGCLGK